MTDMYTIVKRAKVDPEMLMELIKLFEPKVNKLMNRTNPNDRTDLSQELKIMLIESAYQYDLESIPGFWEFKDKYTS
ncbi:hypothetical protein ACTQ5K_06800 [Niallia sp. Sow4_A1]|uniref:Helix-turn-helix conjugative transposon-like domain-containing protein n=2 Tax=Bacillaceae TaxID=186817 RepID=A0ABV1F1T9_9BACI|nr:MULTISPECIES: hypothetical protein [unclassified Bacillus (in: firmicutes)]MCF2647163.1 hypothetical protein [Niallia circulans]REB73963.1 hypothetical protein CP883_10915 [Cutibacterium acnes]CAI9395833.1 hypothetical protein BACSP_01049 [Bacillus sp. T2.9-1]